MTANVAPNRAARRANGKAKVPDDVFELDLDSLKIREIEEIEELAGVSIDAFQIAGQPKAKLLRVIAYIVKKRDNPDFTMEMAGDLRVQLTVGDPT